MTVEIEDAPLPRGKGKKGKKKEQVWLRETILGRFEILNECRVPDHFTAQAAVKDENGNWVKDENGKKVQVSRHINVGPQMVKHVLHYLAQWDAMGQRFYRSNKRVAHELEMPPRSLSNVIKALKEAGFLTRKRRSPLSKTYLWILHWDAIESSRRVRYIPPFDEERELEELEGLGNEDNLNLEDEQSGDEEDDQDAGDEGSLGRELHGMFAEFKPEGRLPLGELTNLIKSLINKYKSFKHVQLAVRTMQRPQLLKVINDGVKKPVAYLWRVLEGSITDRIAMEKQRDEAEEEKLKNDAQLFSALWANKLDGQTEDGGQLYYSGPASEHLIPILREALAFDDPRRENMGHYMGFAFDQSGNYRKVTLEQSARTFVEELPKLIIAFDIEYPDRNVEEGGDDQEEEEEEDDVPF
jgi:hypothetical protein